jgi:hypothetical protein
LPSKGVRLTKPASQRGSKIDDRTVRAAPLVGRLRHRRRLSWGWVSERHTAVGQGSSKPAGAASHRPTVAATAAIRCRAQLWDGPASSATGGIAFVLTAIEKPEHDGAGVFGIDGDLAQHDHDRAISVADEPEQNVRGLDRRIPKR